MGEIGLVHLNRERDRRTRSERDSVRAHLVTHARDIDSGIDGYALVAFRRLGDGQIETRAEYCVRDAADMFILPDLAREKIARRINQTTDSEN